MASYIPALRATRVDPVVALRDEWANSHSLPMNSGRNLSAPCRATFANRQCLSLKRAVATWHQKWHVGERRLGSSLAWYLSETVRAFLSGIGPTDPRAFAAAAISLLAAAFVATIRSNRK